MNSREVAQYLNISPSAVSNLFRRGRIAGTKDDRGRWQASRQAVDNYMIELQSSPWLTRLTYDKVLSQRIASPKAYISIGNNTKLSGKAKYGNIASFDLWADRIDCEHIRCKVCRGSTPLCRSVCYAKKPQCFSLATQLNRTVNTYMSVNCIDKLESDVSQWLTGHSQVQLFRIHSSGDFISQAYLDAWQYIAAKNSSVKFLAFTKCFSLDYSNIPGNFQVIWSIFPDTQGDIPAGQKSFAVFGSDSIHQYDDTTTNHILDSDKTIPCSGQCTECGVCWYLSKLEKDVYFHIH